jgi:hypothetical protein
MDNQLREYTGTGASGGNRTDGNDIPSPRPFVDDEAEMDNYLMKNRYGGEGGHYRKEPAFSNPNRTRFTKFEEKMDKKLNKEGHMEKGDIDLGHQDNEPHMIKGDLYSIGKNSMALYRMVDQFDGGGEVDFPSWWQAKVTKARDYLKGAREYLDYELKKPQIDIAINEGNKSKLLRDYVSSRKNIDLKEQMKKYQLSGKN